MSTYQELLKKMKKEEPTVSVVPVQPVISKQPAVPSPRLTYEGFLESLKGVIRPTRMAKPVVEAGVEFGRQAIDREIRLEEQGRRNLRLEKPVEKPERKRINLSALTRFIEPFAAKLKEPIIADDPVSQRLRKELQQKISEPIIRAIFPRPIKRTGSAFQNTLSALQSMYETPVMKALMEPFIAISKAAGGTLRGDIIPRKGETLTQYYQRQPMLMDAAQEELEKLGIPVLPVVGGLLAEMLLPPYFGRSAGFIDDLAKTTKKATTKGILTKGIRGITEQEADDLAAKIAPITDKKAIQKELGDFAKIKAGIPEPAPRIAPERIKTPPAEVLPPREAITPPRIARMPEVRPPVRPVMAQDIASVDELERLRRAGQSTPTELPQLKREQIRIPTRHKVAVSLSENYQKKGLASREAKEMAEVELRLDPTNPNSKQYADYLKFNRGIHNLLPRIKEFILSDWQRVKELERIAVRNPKLKIGENLLPSERKVLYAGRRGARLETAIQEVSNIDKDFLAVSRKLKVADDEIRNKVNSYLTARHTPERNAAIGPRATGLSDDEAKVILREIDISPHATEVKRLAGRLQELNHKVLDTLYADGRSEGVITKELYDLLKNKYKNHVPLQRVFENTTDIETILSGRGFDVRGTGIRRAVGSERKIADITTNITSNYAEAIQLIEKNIVDNETLRFVRKFKKAYPEQNLFEIVKPKAIGKDFNDRIILERINDPQVLSLREAGKAIHIRINDPKLATAFKGVNREQLPAVINAIRTYTRFYASLATRYNLPFAFSNKIRDIQEAVVFSAAQGELGFKGAGKVAVRDPQSMRAVTEAVLGRNTEGARLYNQMVQDGGTTGGMALATRESVEMNIDKIRRLNRSNPRKAAVAVTKFVEDWNRVFEDSTRLSTYRTALERGVSRDKAAVLAKRATIDFDEFGTGGPLINALYIFANASIQGSVKMLRAMRKPRVAIATTSAVGAAVWAANNWNDRVDPNWRDNVSRWDRLNGLPIVLPLGGEKFHYFTIPVSWGLKPIKVSMDALYDVSEGVQKDIEDVVSTIITAVVDGYNPIGGTDFVSGVTPTILDIPIDIARNRAWTGSKIKPDWDRYAPQSSVFFDDLKNTTSGRRFIKIAQTASEVSGGRIEISPADLEYAYRQSIGGAGRFISQTINTIRAIGTDGELEMSQIPFVNRFFRQVPLERMGADGQSAKEIKKILTEQSRTRIKLQNEAEAIFEEMKKMPVNQRQETYLRLQRENPQLIERIDRIAKDEERRLTYTDRLIMNLGVENGERAKYLKAQFDKLETTEERTKLYLEMEEKGIITDRVREQLDYLFRK